MKNNRLMCLLWVQLSSYWKSGQPVVVSDQMTPRVPWDTKVHRGRAVMHHSYMLAYFTCTPARLTGTLFSLAA